MKDFIRAKSTLASLLYSSGIISWRLRRCFYQHFLILMYHRIIPKQRINSAVQAGMIVEPEIFNCHIQFLREYFDVIPLSHLMSPQESHGLEFKKNRLCAITFDDGWYDFYEHAYPILKLHDVPATVFLPTDFIGTDRWFWTDRLGFLLGSMTDSFDLMRRTSLIRDPLVKIIAKTSGNLETRLEKSIALLKNYRIEAIEQALSELAIIIDENLTPLDRAFLSWDEVQEMANSGLISFGSHTAGHPILSTLTEEEVEIELKKSRNILISHRVVNPTFIAFSYPNGDFTNRLSEMVCEAGYHLAVTTQQGWNRYSDNPYTLHRIAIHQDMTSTEAMFGSRIVNLL